MAYLWSALKNCHIIKVAKAHLYAAFINDNAIFNIVSNVISDNPYVVNIGDAGLIVIEESGIPIEIELLFINPIVHTYPFIDCKQISDGVPYLAQKSIEEIASYDPILYINKEERKGLIFFDAQEKNVDEIVACNNIRFLLSNKRLIGVEVFKLTFDIDDQSQQTWLQEHNIYE